MNDRLYRSRDERMFAGVAGGIAERYDFDPSLVRIVWVILMLLTGGLFFLIYVAMAIVVPEGPAGADQWPDWTATPPAPGTTPGWDQPGASSSSTAFAAGAAATTPSGTPTGEGTDRAETVGFVDPAATTTAPTPAAAATPAVAPLLAGGYTPPAGGPPPPAGPPPWAVPPPRRRRRERDGSGAIIGGIVLVLIGAYFLLRQFAPQLELGSAWPIILVIIGFALVVGSIRRGPRGDAGA